MTKKIERCHCCGNAKVSAQRRWQLKMISQGLCSVCGNAPIEVGNKCRECAVRHRERQRVRNGYQKRYPNAKTYVSEE